MTDTLPTVWDAEPHTLVKHAILRKYLDAWLPILTHQADILRKQFGTLRSREILFIDGFAGPGIYSGSEPGSPAIALESAVKHTRSFPMPVRMLFIEHRADRFERLQSVIAPYLHHAGASSNLRAVDARLGDCDVVLNQMLDEYEQSQIKFGPALAFLDQFGYGAVSMELIRRILSYPQCEVFTYLSFKEMNRWIGDETKAEPFTRAFGSEEWKECVQLQGRQQRNDLFARYKAALHRAGAKYVVAFLMFGRDERPLYWLLFCTNSLRGLEVMKRSMWAVDKSGQFRFSDREDPSQLKLLEQCFDQPWLAGELRSRVAGRTMTAMEVKEFVLVETPCHLFKAALKSLEFDNTATAISAPVGRKPGTFPDEHLDKIRLRFAASLF